MVQTDSKRNPYTPPQHLPEGPRDPPGLLERLFWESMHAGATIIGIIIGWIILGAGIAYGGWITCIVGICVIAAACWFGVSSRVKRITQGR